ncbi:MAG: hypothetical protein F6K48_02905 [Okeania sp. SIO3H1]|nr:hypothetical protein [Okeania sp. SIO3H1]
MHVEEEKRIAKNRNYECVPDSRRGGSWCKFNRRERWVWLCSRGGYGVYWQTADLIDGKYQNHKPFRNLVDALERPQA